MTAIPVGLRIDVDTLRGTREGVPRLIDLLEKHGIKASFFMSVGPDNMGRNLWRLLKPRFLIKMLRSSAPSLYGWDVLLQGTAWPGKIIGDCQRDNVRLPYDAGHEVGLHAWDHFSWQWQIDLFSPLQLRQHLQLGHEKLSDILGAAPTCSAAAGWRCNDVALFEKENFHFHYNSDCRGTKIFRPVLHGKILTPQIPVTLPTYDEVVGSHGVTPDNFNQHLLQYIKPDQLNVYTIHAEVEGIAMHAQFEELLMRAADRNIEFQPLVKLLPEHIDALGSIAKLVIPGRDGWVATQMPTQRIAA